MGQKDGELFSKTQLIPQMILNRSSKDLLISFFPAFLIGVFFWFTSDLPPYSSPTFEVSSNYWGWVVETLRAWHHLELSFWNLGIGAGASLYACGQYPVFNVFNAFSRFLDNDHMLLLMMILPYVIGFSSCTFLLLNGFKVKWPYAIFGGLYFVSMHLSKFVSMTQPFFMWSSVFFPWMVFVNLKLREKNFILASALTGALIALQFSFGGVIELPQIFIWWVLWMVLFPFFESRHVFFKRTLLGIFFLAFMTICLFGIQLVPTLIFTLKESARLPGYYSANTFPLNELWDVFDHAFLQKNRLGSDAIFGLVLMCLASLVAGNQKLAQLLDSKKRLFFNTIWITTLIYFLIPQVITILFFISPPIGRLFLPLTTFSFKYGLPILDFCFALTFALVLNHSEINIKKIKSKIRKNISILLAASAWTVVILPIFKSFVSHKYPYAPLILLMSGIIFFHLSFQPKKRWFSVWLTLALILLGFFRAEASFRWDNKGIRNDLNGFGWRTPEMQYYRNANGKFLLPNDEPPPMSRNYNLVYGVRGTAGFFAVPPYRFNRFIAHYHEPRREFWPMFQYALKDPSAALVTYFPVDFTTVEKGKPLPWKGFQKEISGEQYDIWVSKIKNEPVHFANEIKCISFEEIIQKLDTVPFSKTLFVDREDCKALGLKEKTFKKTASDYKNYVRKREDQIQFQISTTEETLVVLSDLYQKGWQVRLDGSQIQIFPANYLWIAFKVPRGAHEVKLKFIPLGFKLGVSLTILSALVLVILLLRAKVQSKR